MCSSDLYRVRRVDTQSPFTVITVAGNGTLGFADGAQGSSMVSSLGAPALGADGTLSELGRYYLSLPF